MSDASPILRRLESWAIEELGAQRRTLERLQQQAAALSDGDPSSLEARGREIESESAACLERATRRSTLLRALGALWGVDPKSLTLGSIAERCGRDGERLARLRSDLRRAAAATARASRGNVRAARSHQRAWSEILGGLLNAAAPSGELLGGGQLVDAEA